jgi:hypothetical protein
MSFCAGKGENSHDDKKDTLSKMKEKIQTLQGAEKAKAV